MRRIRWITYGLIAAILVAGAAGIFIRQPEQSTVGTAVPGGVHVGGPFTLTTDQGKTVTDATYRGRFMLIYFGYTFCPDVCPTELQAIAGALDKLGPAATRIAPLFVTIDPERDTQAALAQYVKLFDDRIVGLTGTADQIATVAREYRVYYAKAPTKDPSTYLMDHSSFLYLMGPDGNFRALYQPGMTADQLAEAIRAAMAAA